MVKLLICVLTGKSWEWNKWHAIQGKVRCIKWDRNDELSECEALKKLLNSVGMFHAVVDFSGYYKRHMKKSLKVLNGKTKLYVYISSDSVYEVCCKDHGGLTLETDDQRPECPQMVKKLKRKDSYGHKKLRCEEFIQKYLDSSGTKYVFLRLADVVGPRDSTDRFWQYHLWIALAVRLDIPVVVPRSVQDLQLSFVYVKDVAVLIMKILSMGDEVTEILQAAYNLACEETVTVEELIKLMHKASLTSNSCSSLEIIEDKPLSVKYDSSSKVPHIYPSVEKGPISVLKAVSKLDWKPSSLEIAVANTCQFYEDLCQSTDFLQEKQNFLSDFLKDIRGLYSAGTYDLIQAEARKILM